MSGSWMFVQPRRIGRGAALPLVFTGVLLTGFASGSWTPEADASVDAAPGTPGRAALSGAAPRDERAAATDAHEAVSRSGDRWSTAYTAREFADLSRTLDGEYVGVGLTVRGGTGPARVARVTEDSPAARAGLRAGDALHTIDDTDVRGMPVTEVVALLRGDADPGPAAGTAVTLGLSRDGRHFSEVLERAVVDTRSVTAEHLPGDVTRIQVSAFTAGTGERLRNAVAAVPPGHGILLDLRGNSGGLLLEATEAASAFLDGGLVATYGEGEGQRALHAAPGGDTDSPLVVLVDGGSMSAAELLAGALQDRGRALVVGTPTFGKGAVQVPHVQPDGSVAELTVGHYLTPGGRSLEGTGLTPDVAVNAGEDAQDKARTVLSGLATRG
ncbi:PDZ domain-containing protein [Streptomyces sp. JJ66]|uniref:S41 family peptidase n=1 Tax=Streptomyces sp. JJ66 TaxID=2803843 RepID=UPI001C57B8BA|nr:S41 family peptidase [Streptomyces sp. JJ66]MBW1603237.1 PDZ domain-containing protein [Streptomyces sp. JJ66]